MNDYLMIGEVLKPQGIRGEAKIKPYAADPEDFLRWKTLYICEKNEYTPIKAKCSRVHDGFAYITLGDCTEPNAVERLRGTQLYIRREQKKTRREIKRAVAVAVQNATAKSEAKGEERRVRMFEAWAMAEDALKKTREELTAVTKERDELRAALDSLEATAAGCPAAGVRVKKGTSDAHAA